MRFGDFEVKINPPGRKNLWAKILIGSALSFLIAGIIKTHWLASYREGYSVMVPREEQLSRVGPVYMTKHRTRSGPQVIFYSQSGKILFKEKNFSIPLDNMLAMVNKLTGQPVAYLWVYNVNPTRKVWKIDVNSERVLTLQDSVAEYTMDDSFGYGALWFSAFCAAWFVVSIFEVNRDRRPPLCS